MSTWAQFALIGYSEKKVWLAKLTVLVRGRFQTGEEARFQTARIKRWTRSVWLAPFLPDLTAYYVGKPCTRLNHMLLYKLIFWPRASQPAAGQIIQSSGMADAWRNLT